jgi:rubrerythrin
MAPFARAAGASEKVVAEFERMMQSLEPFQNKTLAEFNDFLRRADEFDRTGQLTPPDRATKPKAPKAASLTVDEAVAIFKDLHQRATDPALTYEDIESGMSRLEKLTIPMLLEIAAKVDVPVPAKPKKEILGELTRRIKERKASFERTEFRLGATA